MHLLQKGKTNWTSFQMMPVLSKLIMEELCQSAILPSVQSGGKVWANERPDSTLRHFKGTKDTKPTFRGLNLKTWENAACVHGFKGIEELRLILTCRYFNGVWHCADSGTDITFSISRLCSKHLYMVIQKAHIWQHCFRCFMELHHSSAFFKTVLMLVLKPSTFMQSSCPLFQLWFPIKWFRFGYATAICRRITAIPKSLKQSRWANWTDGPKLEKQQHSVAT